MRLVLVFVSVGALSFAGACVEHKQAVDSDSSEIVGGSATDISALPWQVSLQSGGGFHFCGGSIVAPTWIITAAHCVDGGAPSRIVAGASRLSQANTGQIVQVTRAITAPGYFDVSAGKDLALVELATPLDLSGATARAIRPVTPADSQAGIDAPGVTAVVSGWGTLSSGGSSPDSLQSVEVPVVSLADASADYGMNLTADQIPAGVGGRDSCQGDSGGPLVVTDPVTGETKLAGVVSWGNGCADPNYPGMYARVSSFSEFLDDYTGGLPTAVAGGDQTVAGGDAVTLDASGSSDVGAGSIAEYAWVQTLGTPVEVVGDGPTAQFTAPDAKGDLEFELMVTDNGGNTATDRVIVTVNVPDTPPDDDPNDPPDDDPPTPPGGNQSPSSIVGGCATGGGGAPTAVLLLAAVGLLNGRRRRRA